MLSCQSVALFSLQHCGVSTQSELGVVFKLLDAAQESTCGAAKTVLEQVRV